MQEVQTIFTIFRFAYFAWIPVLCLSVMFTIFLYRIDLVKELFLVDFYFLAICINFTFLLFTVCINSSLLKPENARNPLVQMMQKHLVFSSFWRSLYVCLFILLYSRWTHVSQVSHWVLWWFLATGQLQIWQGNFATIF